MNCQRCNAAHEPDYQLVSTEQGLLCPACVRVMSATLVTNGILGTVLWDDEGPIVDPMYNPYAEIGNETHYLSDAFNRIVAEMLGELNALEGSISLKIESEASE